MEGQEQKSYNDMSDSEKKKEDWMNAKWRPMMGWMYMVVCGCDFVLFPILWTLVHTMLHTGNYTQWNPLTLQGAGLFHIAMGAVLGLATWGRTQEKLGGVSNDNIPRPSVPSFAPPGVPTVSVPGVPPRPPVAPPVVTPPPPPAF